MVLYQRDIQHINTHEHQNLVDRTFTDKLDRDERSYSSVSI